jgi:hypothetical protein
MSDQSVEIGMKARLVGSREISLSLGCIDRLGILLHR